MHEAGRGDIKPTDRITSDLLLFHEIGICACLPNSGVDHTLPASSSLSVASDADKYFRSDSSSCLLAHGKAALNMPEVEMKPSLLRRCWFVVSMSSYGGIGGLLLP